jgi:hypothetical protein
MKIINISPVVEKGPVENPDPINLFYQFFIHKVTKRSKEIKKCLKFNVQNKFIDKIYLLNERVYSDEELGVKSDKIIQIDVKDRLKFCDVFKYINDNKIFGYNVIVNADIFCDETIGNLKFTQMHAQKQAMALLRYEYAHDLSESEVFGPRFDSQDTWILHSNQTIKSDEQKIFNFEFGKPGCDNKFIYLLNILGYQVLNDPALIKTYHIHHSQERNYTQADYIHKPWGVIIPANVDVSKIAPSIGIDLAFVASLTKNLSEIRFEDNYKLYNYIVNKFAQNQNFIIPRIAGIENNYAVEGDIALKSGGPSPEFAEYMGKTIGVMKNNAGIKLSGINSIYKYSQMYMQAFDQCEAYTSWEPHGDVYKYIVKSHDYIRNKYDSKQGLWAFGLDIFHYIKTLPWTHALQGKRVLIVSAFEDSIKEKIPIRKEIYGVDLFPDCEILTIKPPQTQGLEDAEEFDVELGKFFTRLDAIADTYDIALVSAGGYGNLICSHIYSSGRSAIYVGGVLSCFFGIYGTRWVKERPDILRLYLNKYWSRPKESEKPKNYQNIEGGCYW